MRKITSCYLLVKLVLIFIYYLCIQKLYDRDTYATTYIGGIETRKSNKFQSSYMTWTHNNTKFGINQPLLLSQMILPSIIHAKLLPYLDLCYLFQLFYAKLRLWDHSLWINYTTGGRVLLGSAAWLISSLRIQLTILIQWLSLQYISLCSIFSQTQDLALQIIILFCSA